MAVRIRLTRVGATKRPAYRVVAIDRRRARDGRALEILGFYDPLTDPATLRLDTDRINAWIGKGALPSDTVRRLIRQAEGTAPKPAPKRSVAAKRARARSTSDAGPAAAAAATSADATPATDAGGDEPGPAEVTEAAIAEPESAVAEPEPAGAEPESAAAEPEAAAEEPEAATPDATSSPTVAPETAPEAGDVETEVERDDDEATGP